MVGEQPQVIPTKRYSTKETMELLGIHRNTLTNYTKCGKIKGYRYKVNNRPFYYGKDILKCWQQTF